MSLDKIDTSFWLTREKEWMAVRQAEWPAIEKVVSLNRKKTEVNVIKQYFLRGKMPKWDKYRNWDDIFRHLDLNLFLWLHPSSDPEVLKQLYKCYMESSLIHERDVVFGYHSFLIHEFMRATTRYKSLNDYPFPFMGNKNIVLFRVMFDDVDYVKSRILYLAKEKVAFEVYEKLIFEFLGYQHFRRMRHWLLQDLKSPLTVNCLYQYDEAIEWCMTTMTSKNEKDFLAELKMTVNLVEYQKALYCFKHFDTEKEGDTCRTHFVRKIHRILDEREFIPEFKQMWQDVKAGKIAVENPWER